MKIIKSIGLAAVVVAGAMAGACAEQFRSDINPALTYYRAIQLIPDLSPADHEYLFDNDWRGQRLPERFGELAGRYDNEFKLVRQAAQATVPCDWGIDMSPGPATLLPQLARCKGVAQAARLRAMWDLQNGRQDDARDDLLAAFSLARNSSRDGTLIAALVQIAMENILCAAVAENYYQFSPETLKQLADGFDAAPPRGTVAACIPTEQTFFHDWLLRKIQELQKENPSDDAKVMAGIHELVTGMVGSGEGETNQAQTDLWGKVNRAAGGTSEGVVKLLREMVPLYQRLAVIMAAPEREYEDSIKGFTAEIQNSANPLVAEMFPAVQKCRPKEFGTLAILDMVRAAVQYKLNGEPGLKSVNDPYGQGPFAFERFVFEGVDRGFQLKSVYDGRGYLETLIFVEKDGPPFQVIGKNAGQAPRK
ncbi:MAG TPA: hypothetical protein VN887_15605 [Candidatus Angelobacter sp.]|nr:hypothetical protein [Candidatus Angelobacter sp.]